LQPHEPPARRSPPILLGLVGRIGAGKSTVARLLAARGADVIDADRIAHEVLADPTIARRVAMRLGPESLRGDGTVDRRRVARLVFGDSAGHRRRLEALEAILHPVVRARISDRIAEGSGATRGGLARVVVLDIPLLVHGGWADACDWIVRVVCEEPVRRARLAARGWTSDEIEARDRAWAARSVADPALPAGVHEATVDASLDESYTDGEVERLWQNVEAARRARPPRS